MQKNKLEQLRNMAQKALIAWAARVKDIAEARKAEDLAWENWRQAYAEKAGAEAAEYKKIMETKVKKCHTRKF